MRRSSLLLTLAIALAAARGAHAEGTGSATVDGVVRAAEEAERLVAQARRLADTARDVRDLLYYLSDPRGFQYEAMQTIDLVQRDPILGPLVRNLAELYRHRRWEAFATGQAMVDSATPASVAAGAGLTWDAPLCRLFEAQGSVQGFYQDQAAHGALAWGIGGCLPLPFNTFELAYHGRRDVRRSLLATSVRFPERDRGDTVDATVRFYRWLSPGHQIDVAPLSLQFDWARTDVTMFSSWMSLAPVRWARRGKGVGGRDQTFDFMRITFRTYGDQDDGVADPLAAAFSPLILDGIKLGDRIAVGLDVGLGIGELDATHRQALHLDASVVTVAGPTTVELHAQRAMQPTLANQLLDEDRLTARLDVDRTAAWLRVDGFAAHARLLGDARFSQRVWTYGAGADVTMALTDRIFLYGRLEGARGIVADDAAAIPATQRELRGTAGVTTTLRRPL
ncbi:MAG: hypothetical protein R3B06_01945 [Kofleriaceae bacterium]